MADQDNLFTRLIKKDSPYFAQLLERYVQLDSDFNDARAALTLKGKTLADANSEQATWPIYVDERLAELKNLCKKYEVAIDMIRGNVVRELKGSAMDLGRELSRYVDRDERYLEAQERFLRFDELREKYDALSEAWRTRGYALKNRVDMLVHQIRDNLM